MSSKSSVRTSNKSSRASDKSARSTSKKKANNKNEAKSTSRTKSKEAKNRQLEAKQTDSSTNPKIKTKADKKTTIAAPNQPKSSTSRNASSSSSKKKVKINNKKSSEKLKKPPPENAAAASADQAQSKKPSSSISSSMLATCTSCRRHRQTTSGTEDDKSTKTRKNRSKSGTTNSTSLSAIDLSTASEDGDNRRQDANSNREQPASPQKVTSRGVLKSQQSAYSLRAVDSANPRDNEKAKKSKGAFSRLTSKFSMKSQNSTFSVTDEPSQNTAGADISSDASTNKTSSALISLYDQYIPLHDDEIQRNVEQFLALHNKQNEKAILKVALEELETSCTERIAALERTVLRRQSRLSRLHERAEKLRDQRRVAVVKYTCAITDSIELFNRHQRVWADSVRHWAAMLDNALYQVGVIYGKCEAARQNFVRRLEESREILQKSDREMKVMCEDVQCRMDKCQVFVKNIDLLGSSGGEHGEQHQSVRQHELMHLIQQTLKTAGRLGLTSAAVEATEKQQRQLITEELRERRRRETP